ncbi:sugar-binding transcriptional regulator [Chelativorans sp. Marseille-P2723]|uniref:sugar-binding transcriptional regulator n=1 Tax=Chelativorans sp. Marseille-P2723 TaxID=2709133 RepID=UPI001FEE94E5|nr:sugar-binding transcriptional regulator [Chelativorans sp. Marseille-P2723]
MSTARQISMDAFPGDLDTEQLRARVAWLYFVGGMTQQEIANQLGITRLRVNKLIGQARAEGSVFIDIRLPLIECIELADSLKDRYGLEDAVVVPSVPDYLQQQRAIGEAAGLLLESLLPGRQGIGIGWGRTLSFSARRLGEKRLRTSWVVGLMGGVTHGSGVNTFEVSTALAQVLGAECHYLTAPIYCPSPESRNALLTHELDDVMRRAEEAEIALVSCGDLSDRSPVVPIKVVGESLEELKALGSVGEVLGCFMDEDGCIVSHPVNYCIMALPPAKLREKPVSILASGGMRKLKIIRAILRGRYVNRLVTDEAVARSLLAD